MRRETITGMLRWARAEPRGAQRVRFVRVNDVHAFAGHEPTDDLQRAEEPAEAGSNFVHGDARIFRARAPARNRLMAISSGACPRAESPCKRSSA